MSLRERGTGSGLLEPRRFFWEDMLGRWACQPRGPVAAGAGFGMAFCINAKTHAKADRPAPGFHPPHPRRSAPARLYYSAQRVYL